MWSSLGYYRAFLLVRMPNQVGMLILMFMLRVQEKEEDHYDHMGKLDVLTINTIGPPPYIFS